MNLLVTNPPDTFLPSNYGQLVETVLNAKQTDSGNVTDDEQSEDGVEIIVTDREPKTPNTDYTNSENILVEPIVNSAGSRHKNYKHMIVRQLRNELKRRSLPTGGRKSEMIARLEEDDETSL